MKTKLKRLLGFALTLVLVASQFTIPATAIEDSIECDKTGCNGTAYFERHTDPTCVDFGYKIYKCDTCGKETVKAVLTEVPTGIHTIVNHEGKEATCTEKGWKPYKTCEYCDYTTYSEIPAKKHDYKATVVPATCTERGYTVHTCQREGCTAEYIDTYVAALGHDLVPADGKPHSCKETEPVLYKCNREGCNYTELKETPLHDYEYIETIPADCTNPEREKFICKECKHEAVIIKINGQAALGHDEKAVAAVAPTCEKPGKTAGIWCERCKQWVEEPTDVTALGHAWKTEKVVAATCHSKGYTLEKCENCKNTRQVNWVEIDPLSHDAYVSKQAVAPTCTEDGCTEEIKCKECGTILVHSRKIDNLGGHVLRPTSGVIKPTCTEKGYTIYKCENCEYLEKKDFTDALDHDLVHHNAKAATCTEGGWAAYDTCKREGCTYTTKVDIPKLGHNIVTDAAVPATFDSTGLTEGHHCTRCSSETVAQQVIPIKDEKVSFTFEATGINDSKIAVNSGFVYLKIYMNVETEIARMFSAKVDIEFSDFLTLVGEDNLVFEKRTLTPYNKANEEHKVSVLEDAGYKNEGLTFNKGKYLFATLKFKVDNDAMNKEALFKATAIEFTRGKNEKGEDIYKNTLNPTPAALNQAKITIKELGDISGDNEITADDLLLLSAWVKGADINDYNELSDMNKDGAIDGLDFALMRGAIVGDNSYLK